MLSKFNQEEFIQFILENNVVGFFENPIKLKSGRFSNWYVNWRTVSSDVFLTDRLSDFLLSFVSGKNFSFDCFYGVPEGATKLAVIANYKWAKQKPNYGPGYCLPMGRAKPKEHGDPKDRFFVGAPCGKVIVVEDVTTTGGSLVQTIKNLQEANISITAAIGLTNRMEKDNSGAEVKSAVAATGADYYCLANAFEILPEACQLLSPKKEIITAIEKEFEEYGVGGEKLFLGSF